MVLDEYTVAYMAALTPFIAVVAAFITPLLSSLFRKPQRFAFIFSEIIFVLNGYLVSTVYYYVHTTGNIIVYAFAGFPAPLGIVYEIDKLNSLVGLLVGLVFPLVNIVSYRYLENMSKHNYWYYTLYLGLEAGLLGMSYTGDLFNLFVMLEVASITAYGLTAYFREKGRPLNAAIKYGLVGAVGSTIYFLAVVFLYSGIGTLAMADAASKSLGLPLFSTLGYSPDPVATLSFFLALAIWAFMIEAAIFPHHFWLPDAYSSMPSTASATMAAVAEGVGAYVIIRLLYTVVGYDTVPWIPALLVVLGSLNIIVGGYLTAVADDFKKLIAYSTVLDMGYVTIGIGLGGSAGLAAALYYIIAHAVVKPALFISAGAVESIAGSTSMEAAAGVARKYPIIGLSLVIGGLAVVGVPPLNMFFAKLMLFQAVFEAGYYPLLIILLLGSALSFIGFSRLWYCTCPRRREYMFKGGVYTETAVVLLMLIIAIVLTGVFFQPLRDYLVNPVTSYLLSKQGRIEYVDKVFRLYKSIVGG